MPPIKVEGSKMMTLNPSLATATAAVIPAGVAQYTITSVYNYTFVKIKVQNDEWNHTVWA